MQPHGLVCSQCLGGLQETVRSLDGRGLGLGTLTLRPTVSLFYPWLPAEDEALFLSGHLNRKTRAGLFVVLAWLVSVGGKTRVGGPGNILALNLRPSARKFDIVLPLDRTILCDTQQVTKELMGLSVPAI